MPRDSYNSPSTISSTAEFRAIGLEFSNMLTSLGCPKSPDSGQIDWGTVNRPGSTNTMAGYEIRYLDDSLHGTKPCYIKFEFGTGTILDRLSMFVTCGTGTNGSGTISGTMLTRRDWLTSNAGTAGNYPTFMCVKEGYLGIAFKRRGLVGGTGNAFLCICRTVDSAGTPNTAGFHFYYCINQNLNRTTYITSEIIDAQAYCLYPSLTSTSSLVGADAQLIRHFGLQPMNRCVPFLVSYRDVEIGSESEITFTPMGSTSRTYLTLGGAAAPINCSMNNHADIKLAMLYEV